MASSAEAPATTRSYRLSEVSVLLGAFVLTLLLLDADGLVTWVRRMDVGRVQGVCLEVFTSLRTFDSALGLGAPRAGVFTAADAMGRVLGVSEDPLFVQAWRAEPKPNTEPSPSEAQVEPPRDASEVGAKVSGQPLTVLLVGDSLVAGSMGSAIVRALSTDARFRVVHAVQSATGLSRPEVFDWLKVVPALMEREHPDFVVCSIGANDAVSIRHGDQLLDFGEPAWRSEYRARVLQMMRGLAGSETRVLWLGLPPMRDKRFTARTRLLNRLFSAAAPSVKRVEFLEVDMLVASSDGDFATFTTDATGHFVRLRLDDGVHYSPLGARAVSRWVVDWLRERARSRNN